MGKHKNNHGIIRKTKDSGDHYGHAKVDGKRYSVSAYQTHYEDGKPFFSLRFAPVDDCTSDQGAH